MSLSAIALNCSLKRSGGEDSSSDKMIGLIPEIVEESAAMAASNAAHLAALLQERPYPGVAESGG